MQAYPSFELGLVWDNGCAKGSLTLRPLQVQRVYRGHFVRRELRQVRVGKRGRVTISHRKQWPKEAAAGASFSMENGAE